MIERIENIIRALDNIVYRLQEVIPPTGHNWLLFDYHITIVNDDGTVKNHYNHPYGPFLRFHHEQDECPTYASIEEYRNTPVVALA